MLQILHPHIVQAYKTSGLLSSISETTSTKGRGYLIADHACNIRFATKETLVWLGEYFTEPSVSGQYLLPISYKLSS